MAEALYLDPPQPALSGSTLYAVITVPGFPSPTVPMGVVGGAGQASGSPPSALPAGSYTYLVYRQLGAEPNPATDWPVAAGTLIWVPPPSPGGPDDYASTIGQGLDWLAVLPTPDGVIDAEDCLQLVGLMRGRLLPVLVAIPAIFRSTVERNGPDPYLARVTPGVASAP